MLQKLVQFSEQVFDFLGFKVELTLLVLKDVFGFLQVVKTVRQMVGLQAHKAKSQITLSGDGVVDAILLLQKAFDNV